MKGAHRGHAFSLGVKDNSNPQELTEPNSGNGTAHENCFGMTEKAYVTRDGSAKSLFSVVHRKNVLCNQIAILLKQGLCQYTY